MKYIFDDETITFEHTERVNENTIKSKCEIERSKIKQRICVSIYF